MKDISKMTLEELKEYRDELANQEKLNELVIVHNEIVNRQKILKRMEK